MHRICVPPHLSTSEFPSSFFLKYSGIPLTRELVISNTLLFISCFIYCGWHTQPVRVLLLETGWGGLSPWPQGWLALESVHRSWKEILSSVPAQVDVRISSTWLFILHWCLSVLFSCLLFPTSSGRNGNKLIVRHPPIPPLLSWTGFCVMFQSWPYSPIPPLPRYQRPPTRGCICYNQWIFFFDTPPPKLGVFKNISELISFTFICIPESSSLLW